MIAKDSGTGKSFTGLTRYLEQGRKGQDLDRVAWSYGHQMWTDDIKTASVIMNNTAALNDNGRLLKPVYHFSINWHPDESHLVDKALAIQVATEALKDLGLESHQALFVAHKDTDHFHLHVVVNRHNPELGKAWNPDFTYVKLEKAMARLSLEHGFSVVPGHHNAYDLGIEPPNPDISLHSQAGEFEDRTGQQSFVSQVRQAAGPIFEASENWHDLTNGLAKAGYRLETRGAGVTITDGRQFAKASSIDREFSLPRLEKQFSEAFIDFANRHDYRSKQSPASPANHPSSPTQDLAQRLRETITPVLESSRTWRELEKRLSEHGLVIRRQGRGLILDDGQQSAKFSDVTRRVTVADLNRRFDQTYKQYQYADGRTNDALDRAKTARALTASTARLKDHLALVKAVSARKAELSAVIARTQPVAERLSSIREQREKFEQHLSRIYADPQQALSEFENIQKGSPETLKNPKKQGLSAAIRTFTEKPEKLGALKGSSVMGLKNPERTAALKAHRGGVNIIEAYRKMVIENAKHRHDIDRQMTERNAAIAEHNIISKGRIKEKLPDSIVKLAEARTSWTRGMGVSKAAGAETRRLQQIVIEAARGYSIEAITDLPLGDPIIGDKLKSLTVAQTVKAIRQEQDQIKAAFSPNNLVPKGKLQTDADRWAAAEQSVISNKKLASVLKAIEETRALGAKPLPETATPQQIVAHKTVELYAKAKIAFANSPYPDKYDAVISAAKAVNDLDRTGKRALRNFNLDMRTLRQDLRVDRSMQYSRKQTDRTIKRGTKSIAGRLASLLLTKNKGRDSSGRFASMDMEREREK